MTEQWQELKETITEMRDNDGTDSQQDACKFLADYMETLEKQMQQPCEDTGVIKVSKGAVKARQGRFVIYDVDWLKENFYTTEEKIYGQPKQPCEDCISRQKALDCFEQTNTRQGAKYAIKTLPSVTPQTVTDFADKCKECGKIQNELSEDAVKKIRKAIDEMTEIHSDGEFYIKNVDAKWIIGKYLCGAEMSGDAEMSGGGEDEEKR